MLEIWGRRTSSNVQAVAWCAAELSLEFVRYDVGHRFGGLDAPEFLAMNPNGTIPVIRESGGPPIWETGAILRFLAASHGSSEFFPKDLTLRASVDQWAEWAKINVALQFTGPVFWPVVREVAGDRHSVEKAVEDLERNLKIAEACLRSNDFLAGNAFSLADVQFGHVLYRYYSIDIQRAAFPNLREYYDRLCLRRPFREHVMVSFEELRP